jgi:hypothetical protein
VAQTDPTLYTTAFRKRGREDKILIGDHMATPRRFRQGDGRLTIVPDEVVLLDYLCHDCGRAYEVPIQGGSEPTLIDCNEERLCDGCQKRHLVTRLLERGTHVPEERLLQMTVEELLSVDSST